MRKVKRTLIFFACSILILVAFFGISYKVFLEDDVSSENKSGVTSVNGNTQEEIKKEQEEKLKREQIDNIKNNLQNGFSKVDEYIELNHSDKSKEEFIEWLEEKFGEDIILQLENCDDEEIERIIYEKGGETLIILLDEFMEIKDYHELPAKEDGVNITFAGDICLAEDGFVLDYYDTTSGLQECISPEIIQMTNEADIFMINNEFSISDRGTPLYGKMYTFRAMPYRTQILNELGADIVSLANNHVYDFGVDAFRDTIENIKNAGIQYVGGGNNISEAEKIVYFECNGLKIGFISASRAEKYRFTPGATDEEPGIFLMYEPERFLEVADDTAKRCDYLIAYVHWGTEDSKYYEQYQHDLAVQMFEKGIDAVIGGHPHVLQGIEYINGKPVVYSLGDFWFNNETKYTALINIHIDYDGLKQMIITPCLQSGYTTSLLSNDMDETVFIQYVRELSTGCYIDENGVISDSEE